VQIMKNIPVHQLRDRASSGLEIKRFLPGDVPDKSIEKLGAHRDDHYLFFVLEKGSAKMMIDFNELPICESSLYYILPGQVHHRIKNEVADGWFLAVDAVLIAPDYRKVFEDQLLVQQPFKLTETQLRQCRTILAVLDEKYRESEEGNFYVPVLHSLLQVFLGMAACCYSQVYRSDLQLSRPAQLSQQFKRLLIEHIRCTKSPSAYAAMLHVSESYLNEALKKVTGFSVSYWITQEIMLEAKRLLFYSELNVKEIAHNLGYEDAAYFSRLFRKTIGNTPLAFRVNNRK
jgi:AraC family transcriptional activator of pobA